MTHDIVFILVWGITAYFAFHERKGRLAAETQIQALSAHIAKVGSEAASALADQVYNQGQELTHHQQILEALRQNPGISVDEAKNSIASLMEGITSAEEKIRSLAKPIVAEIENNGIGILAPTHHHNILQFLRDNPGSSVDQAKEALRQ